MLFFSHLNFYCLKKENIFLSTKLTELKLVYKFMLGYVWIEILFVKHENVFLHVECVLEYCVCMLSYKIKSVITK